MKPQLRDAPCICKLHMIHGTAGPSSKCHAISEKGAKGPSKREEISIICPICPTYKKYTGEFKLRQKASIELKSTTEATTSPLHLFHPPGSRFARPPWCYRASAGTARLAALAVPRSQGRSAARSRQLQSCWSSAWPDASSGAGEGPGGPPEQGIRWNQIGVATAPVACTAAGLQKKDRIGALNCEAHLQQVFS